MNSKLFFITCLLLSGCGKHVVNTEYVDICSNDRVPNIILPDEVVCNHAPADNIKVTGQEIVYMCTKIKGGDDD